MAVSFRESSMKILICPDKFKECLSAREVAEAIQRGILNALPDAQCRILPLADGGEGTLDALVGATQGSSCRVPAHDPLMRPTDGILGFTGDGQNAVIEMASVSGLALLGADERNPMITTSYGTGEMIRHAMDHGFRQIIVGLGGSATVDGGTGMAHALGIRFLDADGQEVGLGGGRTVKIYKLDTSGLDPRIKECTIRAACDVSNVLLGFRGAARVYGPQKGATPEMVEVLDTGLNHLAAKIHEQLGMEVGELQGGGAAGGLGAGVVAFLGGFLEPGFDLISDQVNLGDHLQWADIVITGEGRMDAQTSYGKTPAGVARQARRLKRPVVAFTGNSGEQAQLLRELDLTAIIPITDRPMSTEESIREAPLLLEKAAERIFRIIRMGMHL
jgi:glycerate kinase